MIKRFSRRYLVRVAVSVDLTASTWIVHCPSTTMSFSGFTDDTPEWGAAVSDPGDIVTNAIKKEKLIKCVQAIRQRPAIAHNKVEKSLQPRRICAVGFSISGGCLSWLTMIQLCLPRRKAYRGTLTNYNLGTRPCRCTLTTSQCKWQNVVDVSAVYPTLVCSSMIHYVGIRSSLAGVVLLSIHQKVVPHRLSARESIDAYRILPLFMR